MGDPPSEAAPDEHDRGLPDPIRQLSTQSEALRARWAAHDVRFRDTGQALLGEGFRPSR